MQAKQRSIIYHKCNLVRHLTIMGMKISQTDLALHFALNDSCFVFNSLSKIIQSIGSEHLSSTTLWGRSSSIFSVRASTDVNFKRVQCSIVKDLLLVVEVWTRDMQQPQSEELEVFKLPQTHFRSYDVEIETQQDFRSRRRPI